MPGRRIVVTGYGTVTPLGPNVAGSWEGAMAGRSGVGPISRFDSKAGPVRIAAEVAEAPENPGIPAKEWRRLDRFAALALVAAEEAVVDAQLGDGGLAPERCGVMIGSSIGGIDTLLANHRHAARQPPGAAHGAPRLGLHDPDDHLEHGGRDRGHPSRSDRPQPLHDECLRVRRPRDR
jgi:3-oxoacyl-[acyl-carrier-protein] synthase II